MWGWRISALLYSRTVSELSTEFDNALISELGGRLQGATVLDCGCGPGGTSKRLAEAGAGKVVAIDATRDMLEQVPNHPNIEPVLSKIEPGSLDLLRTEHFSTGADLVLFKRSLYQRGERAMHILGDAWKLLKPGGALVVALPHRSLFQYAFGYPRRWRSFSLFHIGNRLMTKSANLVRIIPYRTATFAELATMLQSVVPTARPTRYLGDHLPFAVMAAFRDDARTEQAP